MPFKWKQELIKYFKIQESPPVPCKTKIIKISNAHLKQIHFLYQTLIIMANLKIIQLILNLKPVYFA